LSAILPGVAVGESLWAADYDCPEGKTVLSALEFYLPALLRQDYPHWIEESLDGFSTVVARKTADRSIEMFGGAILISDQRWTPFELELRIASGNEEVEWLECRIGSPGGDKGGLDRHFRWRDKGEAISEFERQRGRIDWVFSVSLEEASQD
tara:strand:- start:1008 stop:1463 length:456 start_codon:yes stop_codon:yes gene_type:complete